MHIDTKITMAYTINIEQPIAQIRKRAENARNNVGITLWK